MPSIGVDFAVSNNADWTRSFSITEGFAGTRPWVNVPAWAAGSSYQAGASVVQRDGELYVAKPSAAPTTGSFVASEWVKVGSAALFTAVPLNLTGARLAMALVARNSAGILGDRNDPAARLTSADGEIVVSNALAGGVRIDVPASKTRAVVAGLYAYDIVATWPNRVRRILHGTITVEEGISP